MPKPNRLDKKLANGEKFGKIKEMIKPEDKVGELLEQYPKLKKVFRKLKMDCPHCKGAKSESIAYVARMYGKTPDALVKLLEAELKKGK